MQTPPTSPHRQQERARRVLRDINVSQDSSPHRRRLPFPASHRDENRPPSPRTTSPTPRTRPNARSLAQRKRRERETDQRAEPPPRKRQRNRRPRPEPDGPLNAYQLGQRRRRDREEAERIARENSMSRHFFRSYIR
jgi:hypothetical protein